MSNETILIIEDERDILDILKFNLQKEGYKIQIAPSGEDGIDAIYKTKPDLVILDLMLPGIDGFEVCRQIRRNIAPHG